jgi:ATP-dependent RNA helicase DDX52/ROK1
MKQAGCEVPDYMLKMKNPSKKLKRLREKKAPKRSKISTNLSEKKFKKDEFYANDTIVDTVENNTTEDTIEKTPKTIKSQKINKKKIKKIKKL